ncbi:aryl hydrocarbon receptor-like [Dermatophagoides farinae]|uniref:Aryl hydrocarbon receptor-like n=1 Tax=Dermatophagoides farinae TaxID=6954 RepID=A0A9D4SKW7_DERFA|nr:aryl hydrocarbon receptor-like [Dermatophagoides farinae]
MTTEMTAAAIAIEAMMESDLILQALNGFLLILTCEGEVFYTSHTVETYLGFHQSDICHQSVYELVHSEDREELQRHLMWNSNLPADRSTMKFAEILLIENCHLLERNFTVRFRCLLDNTSGFLRLDVRGRIKVLHGQNHKSEEPPMALFAVCTPFGPPSLLEMPANEKASFKSKHKLDFSMVSMEPRGRSLLGYNESDIANRGGYDLIHQDDLFFVASAHQELLKTGASVMIAYRLVSKDCLKWQWLQTSARLVYKNSKPDFILCTHRPLMEEEGRDLLSKRTMDFKVTYLDGGLGAITVNRTNCSTSNGGSQTNSCNFLNDSNAQSSSSGATTTTNKTANDSPTGKQTKSSKSERSTSRSSSRNTNSVNSVCDANGNATSNGSHSATKCNNDSNTNASKLRYQAADSTSGSSHSDSQSQSHNQRNSRSNNNTKGYMTATTNKSLKSSSSSSLKSSAKKNKSSSTNMSSCMSRYESPNSFAMTSNHTSSINSQHYLSTPPLEASNVFDRNNSQDNLKITGDRNVHFDSTIATITNHANTSTTSLEISDISSANIRPTTSNYTNSSGGWSSAIHHHSNPYSALLDESGSLHLASEAPSHSMLGHQHTATSAYHHHHHHSGHPHSLSIGGLDCGTAAAAAAVAAAAYNAAHHNPATVATSTPHQPYSHHQTITSLNNDSLTPSSSPLHQHRQQTHHTETGPDTVDTDSTQPNYAGSVSSALNIALTSSESPSTTDVSISVTASNDVEHNVGLLSRAPTTSFFSAENLLNYSSTTRHNQSTNYGTGNACSSTSETTGNDIYAVAAAAAIHQQRHGQYVMGGHTAGSHPYTHHHYGTAASSYHHQLHQNSGMATSSHHHPHTHTYSHDNLTNDDGSTANLSGGYLRNPVTGFMYSDTFSGFHDANNSTTTTTTNPYRLSSSYNYGHHHHQNMSSLSGSEAYSIHCSGTVAHSRNNHHSSSSSSSSTHPHLTSSLSNGSEHSNSTSTFGSVYGTHSHPHLAFAAHPSLAAASCSTNEINAHQSFFNAAAALDHSGHHHHHQHSHPHQTTDAFAGNFNMHVPLWNGLGMLSSASSVSATTTNNHTPIVTDFCNGSSFSSFKTSPLSNNDKQETDDDHPAHQHHDDQQQSTGNKMDQYFKKRKLKHCTANSLSITLNNTNGQHQGSSSSTTTTTTTTSSSGIVHLNHNPMSADTPPASSSSSSSSSSTTLIDEYNLNGNDDNGRKRLRSSDSILEHNNNDDNNSQPNPLLWNSLMASTTSNSSPSATMRTACTATTTLDSNNNKSITSDTLNIMGPTTQTSTLLSSSMITHLQSHQQSMIPKSSNIIYMNDFPDE